MAVTNDAKKDIPAEKKEVSAKKTVVYIGPQLPNGLLKTNTTIIGTDEEIEEGLKDAFEKYPLVKRMLVPVNEVAAKKVEVETKGKILNKYYTDIMSQVMTNEEG